jgi:hypothetical protein
MASLLIFFVVAVVVVLPSVRGQPGIGVLAGVLLVAAVTWLRGEGVGSLGLEAPSDWGRLAALALAYGISIAFLSLMVIDPLVEKFTGHPHDISAVNAVRGNVTSLIVVIISVWVLVAFVEEILYRGFLMTELVRSLGTSTPALVLNLLGCAAIFGLSHWYQGPSGVWSTGAIGLLLGVLFILTGFNLWLPILVHGVVDTVLLTFIYLNKDEQLKHLIIRS